MRADVPAPAVRSTVLVNMIIEIIIVGVLLGGTYALVAVGLQLQYGVAGS